MLSCAVAFLLGLAADVVWVWWARAANKCAPLAAAICSVFIILAGTAYTVAVVESDIPLMVSYLAGAFTGTYWAVARQDEK